jgi:hypothetical protein
MESFRLPSCSESLETSRDGEHRVACKAINDKNWDEKTSLEKQHSKFLQSLLPLAFAMKEFWRHKMDHIANKLEWMDTDFSPEVANDIVSATRAFMRRLAADSPQQRS